MNNAAIEQPAPMPGAQVVLHDAIRHITLMKLPAIVPDLEARAEMGRERYGTYLMTHNGRDAAMDCYQELLDAYMYIIQSMMELPPDHVHELSRVRLYIVISLQWLREYLDLRTRDDTNTHLAAQDS